MNLTTTNPTITHVYSASAAFTIFPDRMLTIHLWADAFVFSLSLLANGALVVLTLRETNSAIRAYTNVLIINCVFDTVSTVAAYVTGMQMEFGDGYIVMIVGNQVLNRLPIFWHYVLVHIYIFFTACAIHVIAVSFYFRFMLVCKNQIINTRELLKMLVIPVAYGFLESIALALSFYEISNIPERGATCQLILDHPIWRDPITGQPPERCILSRIENPWLVTFIAAAVVIHSIVYAVMAKCGFDILQTLQKNSNSYSKKTKQMHRQMNFMQFTQMLAPFFTAFTPVAMFLVFPVFRLSFPGIGLLVCLLFACIPLANPIIAIGFVASFRRTLIGAICPCYGAKSDISANGDNTTIKDVTAIRSSMIL